MTWLVQRIYFFLPFSFSFSLCHTQYIYIKKKKLGQRYLGFVILGLQTNGTVGEEEEEA